MDLNELISRCYGPELSVESDILRQALEEEKADKAKEAVRNLRSHINDSLSVLKREVVELRSLRKREREKAELVKKLDRAVRYFHAKGNPLPYFRVCGNNHAALVFCRSLGIDVPADDAPEWNVPDDFVSEPTEK